MQMTTLSTQLSWWDLSEGRGVLEIEPPAAGHELALELEVLWGATGAPSRPAAPGG